MYKYIYNIFYTLYNYNSLIILRLIIKIPCSIMYFSLNHGDCCLCTLVPLRGQIVNFTQHVRTVQ